MRIIIDATRCQGHARCCAVAPNVFHLNDDGYIEMPDFDVPPELEADARRGMNACPERVIQVVPAP